MVVMMIGEFYASRMSFNIGSYFVFIFFAFMMVMVVTNLLNGLAVSDTQTIWKEAELVAYRSRLQLVHHYECMVFGGSFNKPCVCLLTCGLSSLLQCCLQNIIIRFSGPLKEGYLSVVLKNVPSFTDLYMERSDCDIGFIKDTCSKIGNFMNGNDREVLLEAKNIADKRQNQSRHENIQIVNS
jgi:hypothetical protein